MIFCQSMPCIWYSCWKPFDVFISLYVLVEHLFHHVPNSIIKYIEVTIIRRSVFLSDIIRNIFIEIIDNRTCCVATIHIVEWRTFFHKIIALLHKDVSSTFPSNDYNQQLHHLLQWATNLFQFLHICFSECNLVNI